MIDLTSFYSFYTLFPGAGGQRWGMHDEMKADIDKNGRCTGTYSSVMQLYDAPFSFSANAFLYDSISWGNGDRGGTEGSGKQTKDTSEPFRTSVDNAVKPLCSNVTKCVK